MIMPLTLIFLAKLFYAKVAYHMKLLKKEQSSPYLDHRLLIEVMETVGEQEWSYLNRKTQRYISSLKSGMPSLTLWFLTF